MAIYLLVNVAFLRVVPLGSIAGQKMAAGVVAQHLFGGYGDTILRVIMIISLLSAVNSNVLMAPRVLFAMSRDRLFWRARAEVNKGGTPDIALLFSSFLAAVFVISRHVRAGHRHAGVLLRGELHAVVHVALRPAPQRARCAAAVPRHRTSLHDRPGAAGVGGVSHRRRHQRHAQLALRRRRSRSDDPVVPSRATQMSGYRFDPGSTSRGRFPSRYYFDQSVLDDENRNIFARSWQLAGRADRCANRAVLHGDDRGRAAADRARFGRRVARAVERLPSSRRSRRERGGEASRSAVRLSRLDVRTRWPPAADAGDGRHRVLRPRGLFAAAISRRDLERAGLREPRSRRRPSLADFLGDLVDRLAPRDYDGYRLAARKEWALDCNWKVYVDNYLEGYHIPIVHPGLFRELDYPKLSHRDAGELLDPARAAQTSRPHPRQTIRRRHRLLLDLAEPDAERLSRQLLDEPHRARSARTRTLTLFDWYFRDPDATGVRSAINETIAFSDEIQIEDIDICEAVQRGLRSSTYDSGRYSPSRENGVHHFHGLYAAAMLSARSAASPCSSAGRLARRWFLGCLRSW